MELGYSKRVARILEDGIKLFKDPTTRELHTRQAGAVKKLCRECRDQGLPVWHLHKVAELTNLLIEGILQGVDLFLEPLRELIEIHGYPFVRYKSFEALEYTKAQLAAISTIGRAMCIENVKIQREIAIAISRFAIQATKGYSTNAQEKHLPFSIIAEGGIIERLTTQLQHAVNTQIVENVRKPSDTDSTLSRRSYSDAAFSGNETRDQNHLSQHLGDAEEKQALNLQAGYNERALAWSKGYLPVTLSILEALRELSFHQGCAQLIVKSGAFSVLGVVLRHDHRTQLVKLAVEIIWNILDIHPPSALMFGSKDANFEALSDLLIRLEDCYRLKDKELRNELAVVLCLLARERGNHMMLVLNQCLAIAIHQSTKLELGQEELASMSLSESDFEYKNTLWAFIQEMVYCDLGLSIIIENKIAHALLVHLDPEMEEHPSLQLLNSQQKIELKRRALHLFMKLLPRAPRLFIALQIHQKFMAFILVQIERAVDGLQHLEVTQRLTNLVLQTLVKVIYHADTTNVHIHRNDFRLMFTLFNDSENSPADRANAVLVLGLLCDHHPYNQRIFRKEGGIKAIGSALQALTSEGGAEVEMLLSVLQCVSYAIIGNPRNEAHWLRLNGLDLLLDTLCVCAPEMRSMVLGCLSDLLLNPKAIPYFWEWKGQPGTAIEDNYLSLAAHIPSNVRSWQETNVLKKKRPRNDKEDRKIDEEGSPAAQLLVRTWNLHRPEIQVSEVLEEIIKVTKEKAVNFDEAMADTVFNSLRYDTETGNYTYHTHENGQARVLPRERAIEFKAIFDRMDTDGSGELDMEELVPIMRSLNQDLDPSLLSELVEKIDIDGNGQIDFMEMLAFLLVQEESKVKRQDEPTPTEEEKKRKTDEEQLSISNSRPSTTATEPEYRELVLEAPNCIFDESVRYMIHCVISLVGNTHKSLNKDQKSHLNIIMNYNKLIQGLQWGQMRGEIEAELREEGLKPLESDLKWISSQLDGYEDLVIKLKSFSFDDDAAELKIQTNLLDEFVGSVKMKIVEKGKAISEEKAARPASVKQRKAAKDLKEDILRNSLDMRETLKRTLHCKEDELDDLIVRAKDAMDAMRTKKFEEDA